MGYGASLGFGSGSSSIGSSSLECKSLSDVSPNKELVSSGGYGAVPVRVIGPEIDGVEAGGATGSVWVCDTGSKGPVVENVSEEAEPVLGGGSNPLYRLCIGGSTSTPL